jgi:replicative DNA helicase
MTDDLDPFGPDDLTVASVVTPKPTTQMKQAKSTEVKEVKVADPLAAFERLTTDTIDTRPGQREVEAVIASGLLSSSPDVVARVVEVIRPTDFAFTEYRAIATTVWSSVTAGRHIDRVVFDSLLPKVDPTDKRKTKDRDDTLQAFDAIVKASPILGKVESYLTIFTDEAKKRMTLHLLDTVKKEFSDHDTTATAAASRAFEIVTSLEVSQRLVGAAKSEGEVWSTYVADLESNQKSGREYLGLNTGFDHLNNVANGLTEGLVILGAAPSTGKTTLAKQLADQVAELNDGLEGRRRAACLFVSLEQSKEELRVKSLSRLSGIENRDILRGRLDTSSPAWAKVKTAAADYATKVADRVYILEGDKSTTPERIRLAALQVKRLTEADTVAIVIDYLQIVPTEEDFKDSRQRVDSVVSDLRRLARELHSPVVAISSLGRVEYDTPSLKSFKESGGIEYGADLGVVMSRDKNKTKGQATIQGVTREYKPVCFDIVKNRNGERSRIEFKFFPAISLFIEVNKSSLPEDDPGDG